MADTGAINVYVRGIGTAVLADSLSDTVGSVDKQIAVISGKSEAGDGGEGLAVWYASATDTSDNATIWGTGTGRWKRAWDGLSVNVKWTGATGDGSTDDYAAINAAKAIAQSLKVPLRFPVGQYRITQPITAGSELKVIGDAWNTSQAAYFGDAAWSFGSSSVSGSVIRPDEDVNAFQTSGTLSVLDLKDIAVLGPGTGTGIGVYAGPATTNNVLICDNVGVFNMATGYKLNDCVSSRKLQKIQAKGCTVSFDAAHNVTDTMIYGCDFQHATTCFLMQGCAGLAVFGGLAQNATNGILFKPEGAAVGNNLHNSFTQVWIENTTNPIAQDVSSGGYSNNISFYDCTGADAATATITGVRWSFIGGETAWTFAFNAAQDCSLDVTTKILGVTQTGSTNIDIGSRYNIQVISGNTTLPSIYNRMVYGVQANCTFTAPAFDPDAAVYEIMLIQQGAGGYNITWPAGMIHMTPYSNSGNTLGKYWFGRFVKYGSYWICVSSSGWVTPA